MSGTFNLSTVSMVTENNAHEAMWVFRENLWSLPSLTWGCSCWTRAAWPVWASTRVREGRWKIPTLCCRKWFASALWPEAKSHAINSKHAARMNSTRLQATNCEGTSRAKFATSETSPATQHNAQPRWRLIKTRSTHVMSQQEGPILTIESYGTVREPWKLNEKNLQDTLETSSVRRLIEYALEYWYCFAYTIDNPALNAT